MNIESLVRPCLSKVAAYQPGKPIAEVQRELGLKRIIKLASNESFMGPSPKAVAAMRRAAKEVHFYPEGASPLLRRAVASEYGVLESQVVIGNGSDELIRMLAEAFLGPGDSIVASQFAFVRFKQHARLMGADVVEVPMKDWRHDLDAMAKAVTPKTKLLFVATPNNPTGTYNTGDEVENLLKEVPSDVVVVLDEAYYHYALDRKDYHESLPHMIEQYPNLVVMRTFSKAYGLAGLRVGLAVCSPDILGWIERVRLPFNVNSVAQEAALAALEDRAFLKRCVEAARRSRQGLVRELKKLGLDVVDNPTNFVFVPSPVPAMDLFRSLLKLGVIVRPLAAWGLPHHVRISVGSPAENKALIAALRKSLPRSNGGRSS